MSRLAKVVLVVSVAVAAIAYVILLDVGYSAGLIHRGVKVDGVEVGGLTVEEATEVLEERGEELRIEPIIFTAGELDCRFVPFEVGWRPHPGRTAEAALAVGREDAPFGALIDRIDAWMSGVRIQWAGKPRRNKIAQVLDQCEEEAENLGLEIKRRQLRKRMRLAILKWDRQPSFEIPLRS